MQKILVTGGAGFIGSHLCEELLRLGEQVCVIDDLSTGSYDNIRHLRGSGFHLTVGSILDFSLLTPLIEKADMIFHLAAVVGVQKIIDAPVDTIEINILGTHNVLNLASRYNKPTLLASTSEVYGKSEKCPFSEDDDSVYGPTVKNRWSYACSKAVDEFLALAYHDERGLPVTIARLFNTTGPRQTGRYGMVLPRFVAQALAGDPITVFGTGEQTRCFADVSDIVRALTVLMQHTEAVGEVFNIGNPQEVSINQLADQVVRLTGSHSEIKHISYERAYKPGFEDMDRRVPSIEKISRLTGYKPEVDLTRIITRLIDYVRKAKTAGFVGD
jgi:UDP-glucose 4-epimerase